MSTNPTSKNSVQNQNDGAAGACPYLKLKRDKSTRFGFAHEYNYCHKSTNPLPVHTSYQSSTCLQEDHNQCPVFQQEWKGSLPKNIQGKSNLNKRTLKRATLAISILLCLGVITGILLRNFGDTFLRTDIKTPSDLDEDVIAQSDLQSPSTEKDDMNEKYFFSENLYSMLLPLQSNSLTSRPNKAGNFATVTNEISGISGFSVVNYYRLSPTIYYDFFPFGLGRNILVISESQNIPGNGTSLLGSNK